MAPISARIVPKRRLPAMSVAAGLVAVLAVAACAPAASPTTEPSGGGPATATATAGPSPTPTVGLPPVEASPTATVAPDEGVPGRDLPKPPPAHLRATAGDEIEAGIGTYCWSEGGQGVCVDTFAPPVSRETLTVPTAGEVTFRFHAAPTQPVHLSIYDLSGKDVQSGDGAKWCADCREPLMEDQVSLERESDHLVTLPPGSYLFAVFGYWPEGDAVYGFAVDVTGARQDATPAPTASGADSYSGY